MNDKDFKALQESIAQKIQELLCLQELYIQETGVIYIPGIELKERIKD